MALETGVGFIVLASRSNDETLWLHSSGHPGLLPASNAVAFDVRRLPFDY